MFIFLLVFAKVDIVKGNDKRTDKYKDSAKIEWN